MNKCNVIKDLLPLYADKVCSEDSKKMVEEHIVTCEECRHQLIDYQCGTDITNIGVDVALRKFKKKLNKRNFMKVAISVILCIAVALSGAFILFEIETVEPYKEGLVEAKIPIDGGIDVWVNLDNYAYVKAWDMPSEGYSDDGEVSEVRDVYITVMRNNFTKIFKEKDNTDHLWRANGTSAYCFQGNVFYPLSGAEPQIKNIYYLEMDPDEVLKMVDEISFDGYNKTLIWSGDVKL